MTVHGHDHAHEHDHRAADRRALGIALVLICGFMVVEVVVGLLADSLAVLADAGHMLSDAASLGLALVAVWLAGRPVTLERSFGYRRAEILAALANGVLLVVVSIVDLRRGGAPLRQPARRDGRLGARRRLRRPRGEPRGGVDPPPGQPQPQHARRASTTCSPMRSAPLA